MGDEPESHDDLPIALRRTPRRSLGSTAVTVTSAAASPAPSPNLAQAQAQAQTQAQKTAEHLTSTTRTPSKPKSKAYSKKRVRFSDPGPDIQEDEPHGLSLSTGLTPMVRRSSLGEREAAIMASPSHKRKRHSAPTRRLVDEDDELANNNNEIRIIPLRQVLDDRLKRRIRRNGLSEEMNTICESKRQRAQEQKAELQRLRDELAEKDAEIGRLHSCSNSVNGSSSSANGTTTEGANRDQDSTDDMARIALLEQQVQDLRNKLRDRTLENDAACATGRYEDRDDGGDDNNWTLAARDPYSGSYMDMDTMMDMDEDMDDSGFGETTMAELVCSTPSKPRPSAGTKAPKSASASFPTPPCTSPLLPSTPCSTRPATTETLTPTRRTPRSYNMGVQAALPDPEKDALEAELGSLRRELAKLTGTLESHAALQSRIADKLVRAKTNSSASSSSSADVNDADIEAHLDSVLQTLSDRTSTLLELDSSLGSLGFPGNDATSIVASLASSFRSARLELEYLTPGELTLPLSSRGAEVLDLVLSRLRDLGRRAREHDEAIDEYHELELSLRQQLGARVDAMDGMAAELKQGRAHAAELELGLERLKSAAEGYRRDIRELEALVQRVEAEARARAEKLEGELGARGATVSLLETRLVDALARAADLRARVAEREEELLLLRQDARTAEARVGDLNRAHGAQLKEKDARVAELRRELDDADKALRDAHDTICQLRVRGARAEGEGARAREVVGRMKGELERLVGLGGEFLAGGVVAETEGGERGDVGGGGGGDGYGAYFSSEKARRGSSGAEKGKERGKGKEKENGKRRERGGRRMRRRYDSGLGFEDEDEDAVGMVE